MATAYIATTKIAMTFKNTSIPVTSDYATILRYPANPAVPSAGRFTTSAISLAAGTW
jgi:hypothetical protein